MVILANMIAASLRCFGAVAHSHYLVRSLAGRTLKNRPTGLRGVKAEGGQREEECRHGQSVPGVPGREVGRERSVFQGNLGKHHDDTGQKAQAQVHPQEEQAKDAF